MGCGSSSPSKGRESTPAVPHTTENFFPPPQQQSQSQQPPSQTQLPPSSISSPAPSVATKTTVVTSNQTKTNPTEKTNTAEASPVPLSPKKPKSAYVPPAPITADILDTKPTVQPATVGKSEPTASKPESPASKQAPEPPSSINNTDTDLQQKLSEESLGKTSFENGAPNIGGNNDDEGSIGENLFDTSEDVDYDTIKIKEGVVGLVDSGDFGELVLNRDEFEPPPPVEMTTVKPAKQYNHASDTTPEPGSESGMRFDELYRLKGVLGTGAFSTVREGFHRSNADISYAVKCINRKKMSEEDEAALLDEVAILKELRHIHIIRLYDFFVEPSTYYLVMERMRGGELFDRIVAKAYYNEKEARDTCKILLEAVGYCHSNRVAHRDLKPENLLLLSEDDDSAVKIADFGFAKRVHEPNSLTTQCGTPGYVAPEILEGTPYDERADMWSVGVILYILLGGYPPFIESTQRDLFRKIRKGEYEFHEEYWGTVSGEAKDLISSLLKVDAAVRLTAQEALTNAWILGDDAKLANRDLGANLDKLRNFNAKRKFRAAVSTVMAVNKLNCLGAAFVQRPFQVRSFDDHDIDDSET